MDGDRERFLLLKINDLREQGDRLDAENLRLKAENRALRRELAKAHKQIGELKAARQPGSPSDDRPTADTPPAWVKPSVKGRRKKRPGRKPGHPAALRPPPAKVDQHADVPLPRDGAGRESCPRCGACLLERKGHDRLVEDIAESQVVVRVYHTRSGWCPSCRKRMESRAAEQPPAANLPHGQLGINALAFGVMLRIEYRLPFRQIAQLLADLPGLRVSAAAISRQLQRVAGWFADEFDRLLLRIRAAPRVHADETGWRTGGKNGQLWAVTTPSQTAYHVDESRAGRVIRELLGEAFGGTLVSDFYSAYAAMDCKKQKCLAHLLRELADSARDSPAFAAGAFCKRAKRLIKEMLALKRRWDRLSDKLYVTRVISLENRLQRLAEGEYEEPNARRIAARMRRHRAELTAFLWDRDLDGTNNAAERALRPAVVMRKVTGGSRSAAGAAAWAKVASLLRTARQQGRDLLAAIKAMLQAAWATNRPPCPVTER
jgi:transposase